MLTSLYPYAKATCSETDAELDEQSHEHTCMQMAFQSISFVPASTTTDHV
jgi:hypothetical protein